jgi:hypothetical protein
MHLSGESFSLFSRQFCAVSHAVARLGPSRLAVSSCCGQWQQSGQTKRTCRRRQTADDNELVGRTPRVPSPPSFACGFLLALPMMTACVEVSAGSFRMQGLKPHVDPLSDSVTSHSRSCLYAVGLSQCAA